MNEPDQYDNMAQEMVEHCRFCDRDYKCPDDREESLAAVSAALREQGVEIDWLKMLNDEFSATIVNHRQEIERLKEQNAMLWLALTPEKRHELNLKAMAVL